jgi:Tol biopolymer transport system component
VYFSIGERQEDLFIGPADGSRIRHLTDDLVRDRAPFFTRDGKSVVFYSNRDGNWAGWIMRTDGSGLRKVVELPAGVVYPLPSPADDTIVLTTASDDMGAYTVRPAGNGFTAPVSLPGQHAANGAFNPYSFSPDGGKLVGVLRSPTGQATAIAVYDLRAHVLSVVSDDKDVQAARWLPDSRRVVYFLEQGRTLAVLDTVARQRSIVDVPLPGRATDDMFAVSRDGRMIYFGAERSEADIWIAERR